MLFEEKNQMFNLELFINRQDLIWKKYDSLEQGLDIMKSEKDFINNFDRYIIQTLEEVYEVCDTNEPEEIMEELVDVLMYLGTLYAIVRENAKLHCYSFKYEVMYDYHKQIPINYPKQDFNGLATNILSLLMSCRRLFGKRKWHKFSNELTEEQKSNALGIMESRIRLSIKIVISFLIDYVTEDNNIDNVFEFVEKIIISKQDFIINLDDKNI